MTDEKLDRWTRLLVVGLLAFLVVSVSLAVVFHFAGIGSKPTIPPTGPSALASQQSLRIG